METRVAILETLAQQTQVTLQAIRDDLRELRHEIASQSSDLRREIASQGSDLRRDMTGQASDLRREIASQGSDLRRIHDRDFRLTFGAIIATALGLATLIARVAHWL